MFWEFFERTVNPCYNRFLVITQFQPIAQSHVDFIRFGILIFSKRTGLFIGNAVPLHDCFSLLSLCINAVERFA